MIGMAVVGAALGAVLFSLIIRIVPPKRSAIVELGQFYAHYRGPDTPVAQARTAADTQGRIGAWAAHRGRLARRPCV